MNVPRFGSWFRRRGRIAALVVVDDDNAAVAGDCLRSLAGQTRAAAEIVVVSTGRMKATSRALAAEVPSPAVRLVELPSATKAQALRHAWARSTLDYAVLLDGGDVLTPGAFRSLAGSLDASGSPLALAGRSAARRCTVQEAPWAVAEVDLATRMVRRAALAPVLDEEPLLDWLPAVRLTLDAPAFDVVGERLRAQPRRGSGEGFATLPRRAGSAPRWADAVQALLAHPRLGPARDELVRWLLGTSLPEYLDDSEHCDAEAWHSLVATAGALTTMAPEVLPLVPADLRVYAWLAARDRRQDVIELGLSRWVSGASHPTRVEGGRVLAVLPVGDVPTELLAVREAETPLVTRPWRIVEQREGLVAVEQTAFIRGVGDQHGQVRALLTLVAPGGERYVCDTATSGDPDVNRWAQEPHQDHTTARLVGGASLPPATVVDERWQLDVRLQVAEIGRSGCSALERDEPRPWRVTDIGLAGGVLHLQGEGGRGGSTTLELWAPQGDLVVQREVTSPFDVHIPLEQERWGMEPAPLPSGVYRLTTRDGPLGLGGRAAGVERQLSATHRLVVEAGPGAVRLTLGAPLSDDETGAWSQRRLQGWYVSDHGPVDPGLVLLQSYTGQSCTDSPRAIHDALRRLRPDLRLVWAVADRAARVPPGAGAVLIRSRAWYAALATAGYLVTNVDMERWFVKRPGQRLLQTYHGYPSKTMGIAAWKAKNLTPRRIAEQLRRTSATWDLLLTPTPDMDVHYREQYLYDGPIHHRGYPRDDALVGVRADRARIAVRERLGVQDRTVVLYAPTWRDDLATNYRAAAMDRRLDVGAVTEELGERFALLLRGHRFHRRRETGGSQVLDVTDYPEVDDLILAADVAVLDYSSLRFDFALTGRPMLFFVPDLERYESGVRGFLYDFRSSAPGPLLETTGQVVDALRDLGALARDYGAELDRFNAEFNRYQDGAAADRVVDAFFGSRA